MFISKAYDTTLGGLDCIWSRIAIKTIFKSVHWNEEKKRATESVLVPYQIISVSTHTR